MLPQDVANGLLMWIFLGWYLSHFVGVPKRPGIVLAAYLLAAGPLTWAGMLVLWMKSGAEK